MEITDLVSFFMKASKSVFEISTYTRYTRSTSLCYNLVLNRNTKTVKRVQVMQNYGY